MSLRDTREAGMLTIVRARCYKDLLVWQKGMEICKQIYELTRQFPAEEKFGLVSQMRRAAISIPSNIAEGQARHATREFVQSISHAEGSLAELDTQLLLSIDLGFCKQEIAGPSLDLAEELKRMLNALRRKLEAQESDSSLVTRHSSLR